MKIAKSANYWLTTLALGTTVAFMGCDTTSSDDDDAVSDDDDATDDDDVADDDDAGDDDDDDAGGGFDADGLTFQFELVSTTADVGDDDDSAMGGGEGRGLSYQIATEFTISYWVDIMNGIPNCDQHVTITGEAWFEFGIVNTIGGQGDCENCTGFIEYDPTTLTDISNPALDPDHCAPADLQAVGADYATRMLAIADPNATPTNYGDFLTTATWDYETHNILGTDVTVSAEADRTAAGSTAEWAQYSLTYSHTGFTHAHPQSLAGSAGLDGITRPPHAGSDYLAAWEIFLNPKLNEHDPLTNADMVGTYGGSANYILTLGAGG